MTCQPESPLKHKHHITPRYRGGSNDPSNLVKVSAVQHAMWHFCNYQLWGEPEDRLAWRALAGSVGKEEIILEKLKIASFRGREKIKKKIDFQRGEKNSQYGTRWIHNLELKVSSRVKGDYPLPDGWKEGRVIDFDKRLNPTPKPVRKKPRLGVPRDWIHDTYGVVLNTTSSELCEKYKNQKLDKGALSQVALGRSKNHKGWKALGSNNQSVRKGRKPRNWVHPVHGEVRDTPAKELVGMFPEDGLNLNSLYRVANGKAKLHKKWKLME